METQIGLPGCEHKTGNWKSVPYVAALYEVSEQAVRNWIKEEIIQKPVGNLLSIEDVIRRLYRYQRKLIEGTGSTELIEERVKHETLKRELTELELAEKKSQLVKIDDVITDITGLFVIIRTKLLWLPRKIAQLIPNESNETTRETITQEQIYDILRELELYDPGKFGKFSSEVQAVDEINSSSDGNNNQSVG